MATNGTILVTGATGSVGHGGGRQWRGCSRRRAHLTVH